MAFFKITRAALYIAVRSLSTSCSLHSPRVAVVLSGSGVYDGSELHESSSVLIHLTRGGAEPVIFAPDENQMHVINHCNGEPSKDVRNVLIESARIARGKIQPLKALQASAYDAVVFPGGFGAAKNLSTFATDGANCKINADVERVIKEFHTSKKPIALCCIAPVLAARVLGKVELTMGQDKDDGSGKWPYCGAVEAVKSWGAVHRNCNVNESVIDKANLVVTTPAFMYDTTNFHEIYDGVGVMIKNLFGLLKK